MNEINNNNTWTIVDENGIETVTECATFVEDKWSKSLSQPNKEMWDKSTKTTKVDESWSTKFVTENENEKEKENEKENEKEKGMVVDELPKTEKWCDFNLQEDLLRGIYNYGFEDPSEIQKKAISPIISGKDLIAQAQSGSGKTATFLIGSLQLIDLEKGTQVLVLAPTHELAKQISTVCSSLGCKMRKLCVKTLIGGTSVADDVREMNLKKPHIIIGSPGRVYDLMQRGNIDTKSLNLIVMDEADELLSTGFRENIHDIFQFFKETIQVALFSATLPEDILQLSKKFMRDPISIIVKPDELQVEGISQYYITLSSDYEKFEVVKKLFSTLVVSQCIIYVNSVNRVIDLYKLMMDESFPVSCIHSSMTKIERDKSFSDFRKGASRMLISSNITARGIDIQQVGMVINYDICRDTHTYLHRVGRSGRHGRKGIAINLTTYYDVETLRSIEKYYKITISEFKFDNKA